jgi:hypothetical protein
VWGKLRATIGERSIASFHQLAHYCTNRGLKHQCTCPCCAHLLYTCPYHAHSHCVCPWRAQYDCVWIIAARFAH